MLKVSSGPEGSEEIFFAQGMGWWGWVPGPLARANVGGAVGAEGGVGERGLGVELALVEGGEGVGRWALGECESWRGWAWDGTPLQGFGMVGMGTWAVGPG